MVGRRRTNSTADGELTVAMQTPQRHERLDRFTLRGGTKVHGEWTLHRLVLNMENDMETLPDAASLAPSTKSSGNEIAFSYGPLA
ncbi:hypothetical protein [Gemmatimonas sp.]|uniref:hypothetical protein n=1 Tax=Gemmatimonas sp. TaxID=1962908 RepID=UPI003983B30A